MKKKIVQYTVLSHFVSDFYNICFVTNNDKKLHTRKFTMVYMKAMWYSSNMHAINKLIRFCSIGSDTFN